MGWLRASGPVVAVGAAWALAGCIAPDVDVVGGLGVGVDADGRPVIVVEACDGAAAAVDLYLDRQGLADDEENERVASWSAPAPVDGLSEIALTGPEDPWSGSAVELSPDRGYIATGAGPGDTEVLTQVAFKASDLAYLEPGSVYRNDPDPDVTTLVERSMEEFSAEMCSRG